MALAQAREVDVILVTELTRWGRSARFAARSLTCFKVRIVSSPLLTEMIAMFLSVAMVVTATFALAHHSPEVATMWWMAAGLLAGGVQLFPANAGYLGFEDIAAARADLSGRGTQGEGFGGVSSGIGEPFVFVAACFSRANMSLSVESTRAESLVKIL
jgi:hypothetical protein